MSGIRKTMVAVLGALLVATTLQAAPLEGDQATSNGPNMPPSEKVVPSDIRPDVPADTGAVQASGPSGARSRWRDIKRTPGL
ncbi:hypothetical protein [Methylobacterium persicinum]|uniref:Uncharacterized protein n=1 Tax=Methylobacterium persicinum TaxID=374426 RepID=A0ABU0HSS1_9HYPH|nr:hypothetical protein [Methylobacterium persicinum]MDQ0445356.1 hypothetical protein [Methylobacterium persicinum]GJE40267.1 hypothetical protein KHHGKMAE_4358 [Methylobacterium persicinum]